MAFLEGWPACVLALGVAMAAPSSASQAQELRVLKPEDIEWSQRRSAPDVFFAAIYGEQSQPGPYVFRIRAQAGHSLPPHTHPDERTITVLSGTYWAGVGASFDESALVPYPAGSFYVIPPGLPHYAAVLEGEVVFQEAGVGPSRFDVIKAQTK
jgi:quercetin dioxygenase-like cupin family protein